jgi:membrane protein YqaA with SNARE-associated domain
MKAFVAWLQGFAATIGGPGLFIIAFLDSSFLSLPEINDLLLISAVMEHPSRPVYYALMATAGSLAGCFALYAVARRGGEALLRSKFKEGRLASSMALFQRYGVLAILVPSLLPPPAPFKIFVLLAGVSRVPLWKFATALVLGRGARFLAIGLLAARYGRQTVDFLHAHQRTVGYSVVGLVVAGAAGYVLWRRRRCAVPRFDRDSVTR